MPTKVKAFRLIVTKSDFDIFIIIVLFDPALFVQFALNKSS